MTIVYQIDRKLLPMKAHFFLSSAAAAPIVPFMTTYARQLGFSSVTVGLIYAVLPFVALVVRPVFGFVADKFGSRKTLILCMQVIVASAYMGVSFIKPLASSVPFERQCISEVLQYCPTNVTNGCLVGKLNSSQANDRMQCTLSCENNTVIALNVGLDHIVDAAGCLLFPVFNATTPVCSTDPRALRCDGTCTNPNVMHVLVMNHPNGADERVVLPPQAWLFMGCMVFGWAGMVVVEGLSFAVCYTLLGDNPHRFGKQRLWGSVGWGIVSLLAGYLVDEMSHGQVLKNYSGIFYVMLAFMACDLLAVSAIRNVQSVRCPAIMSNVGRLLLVPHIAVFLVWCMAVGLLTAVIWNFMFWHLEELAEAGTSCGDVAHIKTLQGLAMVVQMFGGEIPLFFLSGTLLKRIGHANAMSLVLAALGVRLLCYSMLASPWWVLPVELLQGVTFGLLIATMSSFASRVAPAGAEATMQGIAGAVFEGVGVSAGGIIGGFAMQRLGGRMMFRWFGYCSLALFVVHVAVQRLLSLWCPAVGRHEQGAANSGEATRLNADAAASRNEKNDTRKYEGLHL